ncbi:ARS-binding protein 2 [Talaromyces islandicus]|uniref:ARS-binding protein 2 n=1 Tax=Talaromyces islandicus TaxID=28573 RepID=A0A0U1M2J3_TALIS|nr:ARS-binding protein 2 [Talaromyces islandicus]
MEAPSKSPEPQPADADNNAVVVQQYAKYPSVYDTPLRSSSPGSARSRIAASHSPPLRRKETPPRSLQSSPRGPLSGTMVPSGLRAGVSMSPPPPPPPPPPPVDNNSSAAPPRAMSHDSVDDADRRVLPSRDVTDETIDDAYVAFIMYCNPNVPANTNSIELRKTFRGPPRSDGKSFSTFALWELIRKLDRKELKTWIQLAIELGVEPPSLEKKQSTQKVQQYAVRLKRWMRAMHVDAFFEYLLGHDHIYYKQLPVFSGNGPGSEERDGVPLEEDLALRALVPEWKPKRGRKRVEDRERDELRYLKRPQLDTSMTIIDGNSLAAHAANFPHSAIPFSAFPEDAEHNDPWAAAASSFGTDQQHHHHPGSLAAGQDLRWRPFEGEGSPPGFPRSAVIPRNHEPEPGSVVEPRSAVVSQEKPRRRRHGPAVSSAWPSNTGSMTGKVRGRPPNRGSAPNGPFSSFPVNPGRTHTPGHAASIRSSPAMGVDHMSLGPPPRHSTPNSFEQSGVARPERLHLHVPEHDGYPVRLATPPTLVLNGTNDAPNRFDGRRASIATSNNDVDDAASLRSMATDRGGLQLPPPNHNYHPNHQQQQQQQTAKLSLDEVTRAIASKIMHAKKLVGRSAPLEPDEAGTLAHVAVQRLYSMYPTMPTESMAMFCAMYFSVGHKFGLARDSGASSTSSITVQVTNTSSQNGAGPSNNDSSSRVYYSLIVDCHALGFSNMLSNLSLAHGQSEGSEPPPPPDFAHTEDDDNEYDDDDFISGSTEDAGGGGGNWKQRYMRLRHQMRRKESALREYKKNLLQSVMADI